MSQSGMDPLVINYERLGDLVKTWMLGEDRMKIAGRSIGTDWVRPESTTDQAKIAALRDQLRKAGTNIELPAFTEVKVVVTSTDCLVLRLPSPELIKQFEDSLQTTDSYRLPPFYTDWLQGAPPASPQAKIAAKLKLSSKRIGDYTISTCAG